MNGFVKIPMQFLILLVGVFLFVFYLFTPPPLYFNPVEREQLQVNDPARFSEYQLLQDQYNTAVATRRAKAEQLLAAQAPEARSQLQVELEQQQQAVEELRREAVAVIKAPELQDLPVGDPETAQLRAEKIERFKTSDLDYAFIGFVLDYLPVGLIGLLISVMLSAAMSSASSELNALASTTVVDIYRRSVKTNGDEQHYFHASRLFTLFWGLVAIGFATVAANLENLIQAVNILGSLFYGTLLGIFLAAFYLKRIRGTAIFIGALIGEACILLLYFLPEVNISFLWFNVIGCLVTIGAAAVVQAVRRQV